MRRHRWCSVLFFAAAREEAAQKKTSVGAYVPLPQEEEKMRPNSDTLELGKARQLNVTLSNILITPEAFKNCKIYSKNIVL